MQKVLYIFVLLALFARVPAQEQFRGIDDANPVAFLGDHIEYKGQTVMLGPHAVYVDGSLPDEVVANHRYVYNSFVEATRHFVDGTEYEPMRVYIAPYVYWIDNPDVPAIAVGRDGREPFGMIIKCQNLHLIGLADDANNIVLASKRGQTQGAVGNFTMFDFWGDGLQVSNMTLGNFCNVDLDYRLKPELSIKKRGDAITQAHVAYCHGDKVVARNVRFISRLNMNPLNGARRILFDHCHMECTDDALTGNGVYLQCTFGFYGQKPFYTTHRCGAVFLDCDFYMQSQNSVMAFCKASGPLTIIDSRYHAGDSTYIAWANYPDATLRCYQSRFTLNGKAYTIGNRNPQNTTDISSQPLLNAFVVGNKDVRQYNIGNLLNGDDGWIPSITDSPGKEAAPAYIKGEDMPTALILNINETELRTGEAPVVLHASVMRHAGYRWTGPPKKIHWRVPEEYSSYIHLSALTGDSITVESINDNDTPAEFCIESYTDCGLHAAVKVTARPTLLPQPQFTARPRIIKKDGNMLEVRYSLNLEGKKDMSEVTWYRAWKSDLSDSVAVAVSRDGVPESIYPLTAADNNCYIIAKVMPRHLRSRNDGVAGQAVMRIGKIGKTRAVRQVQSVRNICENRQQPLDIDFRIMPSVNQPRIIPGCWTLDGYKPADTKEYDWTFNPEKDMWTYGEGFNGAVGKGMLQAQRGARMMYTPVDCGKPYGDMSVILDVDPTKTAGQGFGSATGQYMDVCLKWDAATLSGYALRIIRTVKHAKAVDFLLVRYDNGKVTAISEPVSAICYRTGCTIRLDATGNTFTANVTTTTPLPDDSPLAKTVSLSATITPNSNGGIAIQHTGSCGESTTMLHRLRAEWK